MRNLSIRKFLSNKIGWLYILSGGLLLGTSLLGLFYSSVTVPVPTILHIILDKLFNISLLDEVAKNEEMIIWNIRLPRVLLAFCVGASLALAGAAFQGLLRNPLADPYTIGVFIRCLTRCRSCFVFSSIDCWIRKFYASDRFHYRWIHRITHCIRTRSIKQPKFSD